MRPLKLVMNAFGPYARRQEIDFTELGDSALFLIHGPTGGGKTTILDAICYALYGETSGKERDDKHLRSDLAKPDDIAEVELTFAVGDRRFRVNRTPTQERARKYAEGTTVQAAKAQLIELDPDGEEQEVLGSKIGEVNSHVSEILGFQSDQFRQVIMLPQGQFRKLLMASSKEREQILARLFDTSVYRLIEDKLKSRASRISKDIDRLKTTIEARLRHFDCEDVKQLEKAGKGLEKDIRKSGKRLKELKNIEKKALQALDQARATGQKFKAAEESESRLQALEQQTGALDEARSQHDAASRAARLADIHSRYTDDLEQAKQAGKSFADASRVHQVAQADFDAAVKKLAEGEQAAPEIEKLKASLVRLNDFRDRLKGMEESRKAYESAAGQVAITDAALKAEIAGQQSLTEKLNTLSQALQGLAARRVDEKLLSLNISSLKDEIRNRREFIKTETDKIRVAQDLARVEAVLDEKDVETGAAREKLKNMRARRSAGQAILLAKNLKPGEPCTVCGSLEHPDPAHGVEDIPAADEIEALERAGERLERERKEIDGQRQALLQQSGRLDERMAACLTALEDKPDRSLSEAESEMAAAETAVVEQQSLTEQHRNSTEESSRLEERLVDVQRTRADLESRLAREKLDLEAARARMDDRQQSIPECYRDADALAGEISTQAAEAQRLQQFRDAAKSGHDESRLRLAEAESNLKNLDEQRIAANLRAERSSGQWAERLRKEDFEDERTYVAARMDSRSMEALEKRIKEFDDELLRARGLAQTSAAAVSNLQRPDIPGLVQELEEISEARETRQDKLAGLSTDLNHVTQALDDLGKITSDLKKRQKDYGLVGGLSGLANAGFNRLSFQRFVLTALLDDVLRQSSERLHMMSKGRFRLYRTSYQSEQQTSGGLDLEVEDAYTGQSRPVSTLSGGESFQAALSLALGLADVVQAYAGGVILDTIFIDEGFGSLDEEALDLAINTLIDLQARGRLVGVISHVAEMKERIDTQLVVSSGERGASAEFRLP